jgi:hypothetical protein
MGHHTAFMEGFYAFVTPESRAALLAADQGERHASLAVREAIGPPLAGRGPRRIAVLVPGELVAAVVCRLSLLAARLASRKSVNSGVRVGL